MDDFNILDDFAVTPPIDGIKVAGGQKLLNVIFVVDCSMSMRGERIGAVNSALNELKEKLVDIKYDNGLELKVSILSFTSNARWELYPTPVEELPLQEISTRAGLTNYGAAFQELGKVLNKDQFLNYNGKIAPPAIMFLTDGEPDFDYQYELEELLKNPFFQNSSRSAVLLGDAIYNDAARSAVAQFVSPPDSDNIVTAEGSTIIVQRIELATMHSVAPMNGDMSKAVIKSIDVGKTMRFDDDIVAAADDDDDFFADDFAPATSGSSLGSVQKSTSDSDDDEGTLHAVPDASIDAGMSSTMRLTDDANPFGF